MVVHFQEQVNQEIPSSPVKSWSSPRKRKSQAVNFPQDSDLSPRKKIKFEPGSRRPVVIILEDVESFQSHVLQDIILICRCVLTSVGGYWDTGILYVQQTSQ